MALEERKTRHSNQSTPCKVYNRIRQFEDEEASFVALLIVSAGVNINKRLTILYQLLVRQHTVETTRSDTDLILVNGKPVTLEFFDDPDHLRMSV